jgi:hypothetical protein
MNRRQRQAARRRAVQAWRKPPTAPLQPRQPLNPQAVVLAALKAASQLLAGFLAVSAAAEQARNHTKH